jgi:hypothetical protein
MMSSVVLVSPENKIFDQYKKNYLTESKNLTKFVANEVSLLNSCRSLRILGVLERNPAEKNVKIVQNFQMFP